MATDISPELYADRFLEHVSSNEVRNKDGTVHAFRADDLKIVDPTDVTKVAKLDVSAIATASEVTYTFPGSAFNFGTGVGGRGSYVDTAADVFATPRVLTAADSNKTFLLNVLTGTDITLPIITAANVGMKFGFKIVLAPTSNSYRISAGQATDLLIGRVLMVDKDTATGDANALVSLFRADVSNDDVMTIGSADATTGNLVGGSFTIEAISLLRWWVEGVLIGDGSMVQVFA